MAALATLVALDAAGPLGRGADRSGWLLVQATNGDDAMRRRAADLAVRRLRTVPGIADARRVPEAELAAELVAAGGGRMPAATPFPALAEARLAPDAAGRAAAALDGIPGLTVTARPAAPAAGGTRPVAGLAAVGAALLAIVLAVVLDRSWTREAVAVLHQLGATRLRMVGEVALPAVIAAAIGIVMGAALAVALAPGCDVGPVAAAASGLLAAAAAAALAAALRHMAALP